jgi:DNA-binding transcriptional ArsR family regulator
MGEDKTTKVEKTLTIRYDILSDIIVSPMRIEILKILSNHPEGLSFERLTSLIRPELRRLPVEKYFDDVRKHLDHLVEEGAVVKDKEVEKYSLSKLGEETYDTLAKVAVRAKSEQIFSNPK